MPRPRFFYVEMVRNHKKAGSFPGKTITGETENNPVWQTGVSDGPLSEQR